MKMEDLPKNIEVNISCIPPEMFDRGLDSYQTIFDVDGMRRDFEKKLKLLVGDQYYLQVGNMFFDLCEDQPYPHWDETKEDDEPIKWFHLP